MELSNYELLRQQNIQKNADFLKNLGIDDTKKTIVAQAAASAAASVTTTGSSSHKKRIPASERFDLHYDGCRKSARVRGKPALYSAEIDGEEHDGGGSSERRSHDKPKPCRNVVEYVSIDTDEVPRNRITATSLAEFIESQSALHFDMVSNNDINHTVMRVQSMSNQALSTRIKAIGSSASETSKRKMLVFYYALKHANLFELAAMAKNVLISWFKVEGFDDTGNGGNGNSNSNSNSSVVDGSIKEKEEEVKMEPRGDVCAGSGETSSAEISGGSSSSAAANIVRSNPRAFSRSKIAAAGASIDTSSTDKNSAVIMNASINNKDNNKDNSSAASSSCSHNRRYAKAVTVSPELKTLLQIPSQGIEILTRPTVVQYLWRYIKRQGLQSDPEDKRRIIFREGEPLRRIFGGVESTTIFGLQTLISDHIANFTDAINNTNTATTNAGGSDNGSDSAAGDHGTDHNNINDENGEQQQQQ